MLKGAPIGKCGVFCGVCKLYVSTKCRGCLDIEKNIVYCSLYKCAQDKGMDACGKCQEFPCLEHYGSDQVYAKKKLLNWKRREILRKDKKNM